MAATINQPQQQQLVFNKDAAPMGAGRFTFANGPRTVPSPGSKKPRQAPVNIMHDKRIYRGSTYSTAGAVNQNNQVDPLEVHRQQEINRRLAARKRAEEQSQKRNRTPSPVLGRKHMDVQTDLYLEELTDKVPESEFGTQRDAFLDRAPSPLYVPKKSGVDTATQIEDGELFDFEVEVQPILEVLVGKTLEQALMEVMEEEELETLKAHQRAFEDKRNAEVAEAQRMEAAEKRRQEEKERRLQEQMKLLHDKQETAEKVASRAFAQSYLTNLIPSVFETLVQNGYFYDKVEKEIESFFLPWLTEEVEKKMDKVTSARKVLDHLIKHAVRLRRGE